MATNICGGAAFVLLGVCGRDDRVDDFLRWPFWAGAPMASRRKKPPIFAFLERRVESEQGFWLQDDRELTLLTSPFKSTSRLEAENAALRHQLAVLRRKVRGRVQLTNGDRL